jgi:Flp pilus assembly pilin Flp
MAIELSKHDRRKSVDDTRAHTADGGDSPQSLHDDERGVVMVEYVVLVGTVMLGLAAALAALGPEVLGAYERTRAMLYAPFP